jgi:hypothetical protein
MTGWVLSLAVTAFLAGLIAARFWLKMYRVWNAPNDSMVGMIGAIVESPRLNATTAR